MWYGFKVEQNHFGLEHDLYIGAVYASPKNSTYAQSLEEQALNILYNDVATLSKKGKVLILGDLNARIINEKDYITQ